MSEEQKQTEPTDPYKITQEIKERYPEVAGPAHSAQGQKCAQCGKPAWHVQAIAFCLDHNQNTIRTTYTT